MDRNPSTAVSLKLTLALVAVFSFAACGGAAEKKDDANADKKADEDAAGPVSLELDGNQAVQRIDVNGDSKPDVFKFFRVTGPAPKGKEESEAPKVLVRKEMDVNFDGKTDVVEYYAGEAGKEVLIRQEYDLDFDGRVDETRHYKSGHVTLIELDLGFDGRTDTWRYYQLTKNDEGKTVNRLIEKRKDTNADGAVDEWEFYTKGKLTKIGFDTTGDGAPDKFTKIGK
jgi:hypothetical protein